MREGALSGGVSRQSASYRQGLVLGLTMAEIMLLLVFCLLIALGVLLGREKETRLAIEEKLLQAEFALSANDHMSQIIAENTQLREALERTVGSANPVEIDEFWRKLVASAAVADELEQQGVVLSEARDAAGYLAEAMRLRRLGVSLAGVESDAALVAELRGLAGGADAATDEEIVAAVEKGLAGPDRDGHRWPPIIKLSEAEGYFFESGKAELRSDFRDALRTSVVSSLLRTAEEYDVDLIEVVGHTDEQPLGARSSNLDKELASVLADPSTVGMLRPADNAGLGLARAVAVVGVLSADERLSGYKILPLSGAQLIQTDETLARGTAPGDVKERRRIEIRLRKSTAAVEADAAAVDAEP